MLKNWRRFGAGLLGLSGLACSFELSGFSLVEVAQAAEPVVPDSGFVPYPIIVDPITQEPIIFASGTYEPAWDGTVADLIAADGYAMCAQTGYFGMNYGTSDVHGGDAYLNYLLSKMGEVQCKTWPQATSTEQIWINNRETTDCNVDGRTKTLAAIEPLQRDITGTASFYAWNNHWGLSGSNAVIEAARELAGRELNYADMNLCIAQYMRGQLNSGESLFTTSDDLNSILGVIRERAQIAAVYYGLISKVLSWHDGAAPSGLTSAENDWLVLVRRWATNVATSQELERLGQDFATAARLLKESTVDYASLLQRQAGSRPIGSSGVDRPARDWGYGQPRNRLLTLLYGGDPMGVTGSAVFQGRGGLAWPPDFVSTDMRDPRLGTLLGLARASDTLRFKVIPNSGLDASASADELYASTEAALRLKACQAQGTGTCNLATIRAELPDVANFTEYTLWSTYTIDPGVARTFARAFGQAFGGLFGPNAQYDFGGLMHLHGQHEVETIAGDEWLHVDKDFTTSPLMGNELEHYFTHLTELPDQLVLDADPTTQGFLQLGSWMGGSPAWANLQGLGSVPALAFVREAIADGSVADPAVAPFFAAAGAVLPELDAAIGTRSVILRSVSALQQFPCWDGTYTPGANCEVLGGQGFEPEHRLTSITKSDDPLDKVTLAPHSPQLNTVARDEETVAFDGLDRAALDAFPTVDSDTTSYADYADGYERREFDIVITDDQQRVDILLRGHRPGGTSAQRIYQPVHHNQFGLRGTYQTSYGGQLNQLAVQAMAVLPQDWSRPAYDAFGLRSDWVPPADAALVGGTTGQPSYEYYLSVAKQSAQEATAAVQTAIDNMMTETQQKVDLAAAEQRAETIANIQISGVCGPSGECPSMETQNIGVSAPSCLSKLTSNTTAAQFCTNALAPLSSLTGWFRVTKLAYTAKTGSFSDFEGGEMQAALVRQWNAIKSANEVIDNVFANAVALGVELEAAEATKTNAVDNYEAAKDDILHQYDELFVQGSNAEAQKASLSSQIQQLDDNVMAAMANQWRACGCPSEDDRFYADCVALVGSDYSPVGDAYKAAYSWSNVGSVEQAPDGQWYSYPPGYPAHADDESTKSFNAGPIYAQQQACNQATDTVNAQIDVWHHLSEGLNEQILAIYTQLGVLDEERDLLKSKTTAADSAYAAAQKQYNSSVASTSAQVTSSYTQVQSAITELIQSQIAIDQLWGKLESFKAQASLDEDLAQKQADSRFGMARKFQSYDMWRARALLESTRRVAVAARRAIEAFFVVDLSELNASQPFVESPSVWADEIYGSDLDAPSVVGLNASTQKVAGAVYPNKVLDYVENLERFVQGYTIANPTAVAQPDTEVLTLPGPDVLNQIEDQDGNLVPVLDGDSMGWKFYCPGTGEWVSNPGAGELPVTHSVAEVCPGPPPPMGEEPHGTPPTKARYDFALDPWGRLNGALTNELQQRHNVRWGRLAVNLVGTGVRDCASAPDSSACYSEPFLRFNMTHVGPSWTTNYAQQWHAYNLPSAFIEGGKALTAEEWIDPLTNGWSTPLVSAAARGEFAGRSIGGSYQLEIELGPEVHLDRIERVQLLVETAYWVRQQ